MRWKGGCRLGDVFLHAVLRHRRADVECSNVMTVHKVIPIKVWVDVDIGIADMVEYLNTIPGIRTLASCQGTIGENGASPYRAQVMATWSDDALIRLEKEFDITVEGDHWGYIHPKG